MDNIHIRLQHLPPTQQSFLRIKIFPKSVPERQEFPRQNSLGEDNVGILSDIGNVMTMISRKPQGEQECSRVMYY